MKNLFYCFFLCVFTLSVQAQEFSFASSLSDISGITFEGLAIQDGMEHYVLQINQPLDHSDTTKGYFTQKVYLTHKSIEKPTVFVTAGYNVNRNRLSELTGLLDANQIMVEHRYFGESMPATMDYEYLNLEQATADLHRIRLLFSDLYTNKWVSTGISKGGATTIFYRYFYPEDVDVSVPYVAPINRAYEDPRIYDFLNTVGTDVCREKLKDFQIRILENREEVIPLLKFYSMGANVDYTYLSLEEAFEFAVLEYPFSFWQWGYDCDGIPDSSASLEELVEYFISVSDLTFFGDNLIRFYSSHYYQAATEMGYYGYETGPFKDYLKKLPTDSNPMALFFPFEMNDAFDGKLLTDINTWLETNGDQFIYIYGANDTWTASAVPFNDKVDSEWFFMEDKHHGNARIAYMKKRERKRLVSTLEKWLGFELGEK